MLCQRDFLCSCSTLSFSLHLQAWSPRGSFCILCFSSHAVVLFWLIVFSRLWMGVDRFCVCVFLLQWFSLKSQAVSVSLDLEGGAKGIPLLQKWCSPKVWAQGNLQSLFHASYLPTSCSYSPSPGVLHEESHQETPALTPVFHIVTWWGSLKRMWECLWTLLCLWLPGLLYSEAIKCWALTNSLNILAEFFPNCLLS